MRIGPPKIGSYDSRKALGPNRITGYVDRLRDLIRPPMAHAHPDITAKVVADDAADSGDPPTQTRSPIEERRMRIDGARKDISEKRRNKKPEIFLNSIWHS